MKRVTRLDLFWPFPLIAAGVLSVLNPVLIIITVVLALIPWPARRFSTGKFTESSFIGAPLVLLGVGAFIGVWSSYNPTLSLPVLLTLLGSISLYFAIVNTSVSPWLIARALVIAGVLFALYFISQYSHFNYPLEDGRIAGLARASSAFAPNLVFYTPQVNSAATFMEGIFILGIVVFLQAHGIWKTGWGLIIGLIAYGLLISDSRGAWLGIAVALGIWGTLILANTRLRLAVGGLVTAGGALALFTIFQLATFQPTLRSLQNAAYSRLTLYRNSLYLLLDYPLTGIGPGDTFGFIYSKYQLLIPHVYLTYAHNLFLTFGLAFGLTGLIALIWLLVEFYQFVFRGETVGTGKKLLFRGAWLGATATFIHGLTDSPQFAGALWAMPVLFILLGIAVAAGRPFLAQLFSQPAETYPRKIHHQWVAVAAIFMGVVIAGIFLRHALMGMWYANLGALYQTQADLSPLLDDPAKEIARAKAVTYFEHALLANPSQPVANRRLGMIALDDRQFDRAVAYLEQAHQTEPGNQATLKALGLAYTWTGQLDAAELLLRRRDDLSEVIEELGTWSWWWGTQNREDLSHYATEMASRLSSN